jgi:hypothetical protein
MIWLYYPLPGFTRCQASAAFSAVATRHGDEDNEQGKDEEQQLKTKTRRGGKEKE